MAIFTTKRGTYFRVGVIFVGATLVVARISRPPYQSGGSRTAPARYRPSQTDELTTPGRIEVPHTRITLSPLTASNEFGETLILNWILLLILVFDSS